MTLQARVWRERLDPDGAKPREDALTGNRRFTIGPDTPGELTPFWGQADPINAALIRSALEFHHHVIHNGDWRMRMIRGKPQILAPP